MNEMIHSVLSRHPNVVVGKDGCKYCTMARDLLDNNFVDYVYLKNTECPELADTIKTEFSHGTFPHIFLEGKFVGGFTEASTMFP